MLTGISSDNVNERREEELANTSGNAQTIWQRWGSRVATLVTAHRWLTILLSLLLCLVSAGGLSRLVITDNWRSYLDPEDPELVAFDQIRALYTSDDPLIFVVTAATQTVITPQVLTSVGALTRDAWNLPGVVRVDSLTSFQTLSADGDELGITDLVRNPASLSTMELANLEQEALSDPLLVGSLIDPAASLTVVVARLHLEDSAPGLASRAVAQAHQLAQRIEKQFPGVTIGLTGPQVLEFAGREAVIDDLMTLGPLSACVLGLLLMLLLRSAPAALACLGVLVLSVVTTMGIAGWCGVPLTGSMAICPVIVMTLALADSVHIITTMRQLLLTGASKVSALQSSLAANFQALFLTSLTTSLGLLTLNLIRVPPVRDLGTFSALGVLLAFGFSVVTLPAVLLLLPMTPKAHSPTALRSLVIRFGAAVIRHHRRYVVLGVLVILGGILALPLNTIDNQATQLFSPRTEIRQVTDLLSARLGGVYEVFYSIGVDRGKTVCDPHYLERLDAFASWLQTQPEVAHVFSFSELMRRAHAAITGNHTARYPESEALAAQVLLLYEMLLPSERGLDATVTVDKKATRLSLRIADLPASTMLGLLERAARWQQHNLPPAMRAEPHGVAVLFSHMSEELARSLLLNIPTALILVSLAVFFALRSLRLGCISLCTNLLPLILAFGIWGLSGWPVNFATGGVAGMGIGIIVDDTIHFLTRYRSGRIDLGLSPEDAVRSTYASVGEALVITSLVLVAGLSMLTASEFHYNVLMGGLTTMVIVLALLGDLVVLPACLISLDTQCQGNQQQ